MTRTARRPLFAAVAALMAGACSTSNGGTSGGTTGKGATSGVASTTGATTTTGSVTSSGTTASAAASTTAGASTSSSSSSTTSGSASSSGGWDGGTRFPATSLIYQDISTAALDPNSGATIGALSDAGGWGTGSPNLGEFQIDFGLTTLYADATVPLLPFTPNAMTFESPDCDMTPVPLPPGGAAEGTSDYNCSGGDCHILIYQGHWLFEMWHGNTPSGLWDGGLTCDCEVAWDLTHDYWQPGSPYSRGDQCTSADAAGMPIAATLVTGAELQAGVVPHALRFTLPNARMQSGLYVHPATHAGAPSGPSPLPIYGQRFRLKSTFDVTTLPNAAAQAVAVALQTYGMFLDDGGDIPLTIDASAASFMGSHDLFGIQVSDFEVVAAPAAPVPLTYGCSRTPLTSTN